MMTSTLPLVAPVLQKEPYSHPYGDLMCGHNKWVRELKDIQKELDDNNLVPLLLDYVSANVWESLARVRVMDSAIFSEIHHGSLYRCPYTYHDYSSLVPTMLLTKDPFIYTSTAGLSASMQEMACDAQWNLDRYPERIFNGELSQIQQLLMGSGYTPLCLMSDGSNSVERLVMDLNNGDKLIFAAYIWHNK